MMNKSRPWILLMSFVALGALAFSCKAFFDLYQFLSLKERVEVTGLEPKVERLASGQYALEILFDYRVQSEPFHGQQRLRKIPYKNRWVALDAFNRLKKTPHHVWYSSRHPEKGVLDKSFPVKGIFSASLLLGILIYFYLLGRYMFKME